MTAEKKPAGGARLARVIAAACSLAMLGAAAWLAWKHALGTLVVLDPERTLTLIALLTINASVLFLVAQPARLISLPLGLRAAIAAGAAASINVGAAAFFVIDGALAASALWEATAPSWLGAFLIPAAVTLLVFAATVGTPPEVPDEISDEDLAEAALILTESQRRWSWRAVFDMAAHVATTRTIILGVYFAWLVAGMAAFDWLSKAFTETRRLSSADLVETGTTAIAQGGEILTHAWIWFVFVFIAVVPALLILSTAVWYRMQLRRHRSRLRTLSQSPLARLMTPSELEYLQRRIERPLLAQMRAMAQRRNQQRGVS
jgi:hypothetical protein